MDSCFTFQWGDLFSDGGASFLGGGLPHEGALVSMGGGFEKIIGMGVGRVPPHACRLWETLIILVSK